MKAFYSRRMLWKQHVHVNYNGMALDMVALVGWKCPKVTWWLKVGFKDLSGR
jgi:hypothetical protein